ncbi:hypothetical protein [Arthrobacter sp. A2-55]|uniref:hypothetical protein n=1 Tax=Arthrobacter sp. A2-55 TaxID=2897337 RepID=UPI0021CD683E|nr:hypothetical protein [Arthrobacter sp. A2-55]MCU6481310.1 hypothetical protein [Arthrobacter sp. A2-55]
MSKRTQQRDSHMPITTEQAIARARLILQTGQQLREATRTVDDTHREYGDRSSLTRAAEDLKENRLLGYRVTTVPDALGPILEALIQAASGSARH